MFSWHALGPLIPTEQHLNATQPILSITANRIHLFTATIYKVQVSVQCTSTASPVTTSAHTWDVVLLLLK